MKLYLEQPLNFKMTNGIKKAGLVTTLIAETILGINCSNPSLYDLKARAEREKTEAANAEQVYQKEFEAYRQETLRIYNTNLGRFDNAISDAEADRDEFIRNYQPTLSKYNQRINDLKNRKRQYMDNFNNSKAIQPKNTPKKNIPQKTIPNTGKKINQYKAKKK